MNCTSTSLRASTGLSPGFALPRARSPGFWLSPPRLRALSDPVPRRASRPGCGPVGFPPPTGLKALKLAVEVNSPARGSKRNVGPWSPPLVQPCRHGFLRGGSTLSGPTRISPPGFRLFSPPFRGTFQLSVTVLVRYRSWDVFSLGCWFHPDSHTKTKVWYSGSASPLTLVTPTGLSPSMAGRSRPLRLPRVVGVIG